MAREYFQLCWETGCDDIMRKCSLESTPLDKLHIAADVVSAVMEVVAMDVAAVEKLVAEMNVPGVRQSEGEL